MADPGATHAARIPAAVGFESKWRQALRLVRQLRAAGFTLTAEIADAEFGDVTTFRAALHRLRLPYALGISSHLTVFTTRPRVRPPEPNRRGRPRTRLRMVTALRPVAARRELGTRPASTRLAARRVAQWHAAAADGPVRGRPGHARARVAAGATGARGLVAVRGRDWLEAAARSCFVALPATASLAAVVRLAHQRWAIEQQYQELKSELGLDHFEGRSYPGWHHHVVLTAVAHAFIQRERMQRARGPALTFPAARAIVQEIFTALLFAAKPQYACIGWNKRNESFNYGSDKVELAG